MPEIKAIQVSGFGGGRIELNDDITLVGGAKTFRSAMTKLLGAAVVFKSGAAAEGFSVTLADGTATVSSSSGSSTANIQVTLFGQ